MKIYTLRSQGFSIVKINGNITLIKHFKPFTVNGKPALVDNSGHYEFMARGWFDKEIPREIVLL